MRRAALLLLVPLALLAASGCTYTLIKVDPAGAEQAIVNVVSSRDHFDPSQVVCPPKVPATIHRRFTCTFLGPQTEPFKAILTITKIKDDVITFEVRTVKGS